MLFNLLLADIIILLCFFLLFRVVFNNFFIIPVYIEYAKTKTCTCITTSAPIIAANDAIEMLPLVAFLKIIKRGNIFTKPFTH